MDLIMTCATSQMQSYKIIKIVNIFGQWSCKSFAKSNLSKSEKDLTQLELKIKIILNLDKDIQIKNLKVYVFDSLQLQLTNLCNKDVKKKERFLNFS